jgi:hypothetical protein
MHIMITRLGGGRTLRVATAAIAYVDEAAEGSVVKLIGGEGIRAHESCGEIEALIDAGATIIGELCSLTPDADREMVAADIMPSLPGHIDADLERASIVAAEQAGLMSPVEAITAQVRALPKPRGRRR